MNENDIYNVELKMFNLHCIEFFNSHFMYLKDALFNKNMSTSHLKCKEEKPYKVQG